MLYLNIPQTHPPARGILSPRQSRHPWSRCTAAAFCLLLLLGTCLRGLGQTSTGSINGTVIDVSKAAVGSASVTLTNASTGEVHHAVTTDAGTYSFPFLPPAVYSVEISAPGYEKYVQNSIKLDVDSVVSISPALRVGTQNATVVVTDQAPLLETETSSIGYEIDQKTITDLPTDGRNVYGLATLVPGVIAPPAFTQVSTGMYNEQFVSINGSRSNQSLFLLDGGTNSNSAFYGPTLYPSLDVVQEFKVQTNNFSAEFSNAAGGVVNVITKSGSEHFHGSLFEFLRNNALDANYFFNDRNNIPLGPYKFNQFGAAVGGPLSVPHLYDPANKKLFFYFSYEGLRWIQIQNTTATVPTALQRSGDFSQTYAADGTHVIMYDPATIHPDPSNPGHYLRDPFPGDVIPQNRFDPVAANLIKYYPLPNVAGTGQVANVNNFYESQSGLTSKDTGSIRFDYAISDAQRIFGRYSENVSVIHRPNPFLGFAAPAGPSIGDDRLLQYQSVIDYTNTITPHTVLELNTSWNRYPLYRTPPGYGFDPTTVGMPSYFSSLQPALPPCFPEIGAAGYVGMGVCGELVNIMNAYQEVANVINTHQHHNFKYGFIFSVNQQDTHANVDAQANLNFGTAQTQGPDANTYSQYAGNGIASFELGFGNGGQIISGAPPIFVITKHWGGYFQDDWHATRALTLNLGVRYDVNTPYTERKNRMTDLNLTAPSPLQVPGLTLTGGFEYPGVNGLSRYVSNVDFHDVQPRLGFAYAVNPKLVVRGGGGLFMGPIIGSGTPQDGFYSSTSWVATLDGLHEEYPLSNPFPQGFVLPTGNSQGLATLIGQGGTGITRNQKTSYSAQWNMDVQYDLPKDILLDVAYAGSAGRHLYYFDVLNQLPDNLMSLGTALQQQVTNPFYGKVSIGPLSQPTIAKEQLLLPHPQFTFLNSNQSEGSSIYHALQVVVKRNFRAGYSFQLSYTYGKLIDDMDGFGAWTGPADGGNIQDWDNPAAERAPAVFDVTHHVVGNFLYELPFGTNKPFLAHGIPAAIAGGWQFNGIATFQGGVPLQMGTISNTLDNNGGAQRPNRVQGVSPYRSGPMYKRINQYFNPAAYTAPPSFTYGDTARSLGYLRGPGIANWDLSLFRNIHIRENVGLQFRAEAFNAFNRTQFGIPDTTIGDPAAGTIFGTANTPRDVQVALKLTF